MECYSAPKRKAILTHAMTWISLEDVTLSGISQSHEDKCCVLSLM